jgi:hypothetical protein
VDAAHRSAFGHPHAPYEARVRVAARAKTRRLAERVGMEMWALGTNGPAGGGGFRGEVQERVGIVSTLLNRSRVKPGVTLMEMDHETQAA